MQSDSDSNSNSNVSLDTLSGMAPSSEDYYLTVSISCLIRILRDPSRSSYHTTVIQVYTYLHSWHFSYLLLYVVVRHVYLQESGPKVYPLLASNHATFSSSHAHKHRDRFPQGIFINSTNFSLALH